MFDKSVLLDIPCPGCGHITNMSIKESEKNPTYVCNGCNKEISVDALELKRELDKAEKTIKDTFK